MHSAKIKLNVLRTIFILNITPSLFQVDIYPYC